MSWSFFMAATKLMQSDDDSVVNFKFVGVIWGWGHGGSLVRTRYGIIMTKVVGSIPQLITVDLRLAPCPIPKI